MRAAGLRPVQLWVPDTRSPEFTAQVRKQCQSLKGDPAEAEVLRFTEETVLNRKVGDETFSAISKHLSHEELVELAIAAGCYMMVSIFLNTFEVDLEGYEVPL